MKEFIEFIKYGLKYDKTFTIIMLPLYIILLSFVLGLFIFSMFKLLGYMYA